jgi:diaminopimelate epimerase
MSKHFFKMTGSGNDFVFFDGRETSLSDWPAERIAAVCNRRTGVGADGIVVVSPEGPGAARMIYCNADGSRAGMCGNAALCSTRLAARLGFGAETGMELHTDTGILRTRCVGPGWAAELLLPDFRLPAPVDLPLERGETSIDLVTVGVPHLMIHTENLGDAPVTERGEVLRYHSLFAPEGLNVNWVGKAVEGDDPVWQLRTYERGVEAETLACGTGTVGAAFTLANRGLDRLPIRIRSWGGNVFSVAGRIEPGPNGSPGWAREPWLCGEGKLVFEGQLL